MGRVEDIKHQLAQSEDQLAVCRQRYQKTGLALDRYLMLCAEKRVNNYKAIIQKRENL